MAKVMLTNDCFAFDVWVHDRPEFRRTVNARSAAKAKAAYLLDLQDAWPNYKFTDLRVRKVGRPHTSEGFRRNAAYRGMPQLECGQRVIVGDGRGVIVGHNSSANFDVLFDDDSRKYAGMTLNVHPGEIKLESESASVN
jgi:hypothetical protein